MMKIYDENPNNWLSKYLSVGLSGAVLCVAVFFLALCLPGKSYAFQLPWPGKCLTEYSTTKTINGLCKSTTFPTGKPEFDQAQEFQSMLDYPVEDSNTVPVEGDYRIRILLCVFSTQGTCKDSAPWWWALSVNTTHLVPNLPLSQQDTNFGAGYLWNARAYDGPITMCLELQNKDTKSTYIDNNLPYPCEGATPLAPVIPSTCSLNSSQGLTVAFNEIDRSDISTTPASQTSGNVEKTIPVTCTGETAFTVKTKFTFTPITVSNNQVVASSNPNLGVAIIYNGKVVSPTDVFDETYQLGTNNINLEFQVVHDSSVATKDIATGDFSASAVMVMTQQ
ncbi:fimbrial protein [Erwinia billingiae]|uniref:fimbrial protein n=1 Tax=Erwinia billingiae TaxID=182337 RepID=UPI0019CF6E6D|nr:fimbrial protein [Erwinia billingiae]